MISLNVLLLVVLGANLLSPYFAWTKISGIRHLASTEHLTHELIPMHCRSISPAKKKKNTLCPPFDKLVRDCCILVDARITF